MNKEQSMGERAIATFLVAAIAFSPIFLSIFAKPILVFGIPLLYIYLFGAWACVILAIALNAARRDEDPEARRKALRGKSLF